MGRFTGGPFERSSSRQQETDTEVPNQEPLCKHVTYSEVSGRPESKRSVGELLSPQGRTYFRGLPNHSVTGRCGPALNHQPLNHRT